MSVDHDPGRRLYEAALAGHRAVLARLSDDHRDAVLALADDVLAAWRAGGRLLICGNGGSAADAQHIAAELVGRFERERPSFGALALTANSSITTAVGNDYGFEAIFARQVEGLGGPHDVLLVLSTSGNSANCVRAVAAARAHGMRVHGFLGGTGGALGALVDGALIVPSAETPRIQEIHILLGHVLCNILEDSRTEASR
jgi:D-sedoheptulose 7-phosphate isomerase